MRRICGRWLHFVRRTRRYMRSEGTAATAAGDVTAITFRYPSSTDWSMPIFDGLELAQMIRAAESKGNPFSPPSSLWTGPFREARVDGWRAMAGVKPNFSPKPISAKGALSEDSQRRSPIPPVPSFSPRPKRFRPGPPRAITPNAYIGPATPHRQARVGSPPSSPRRLDNGPGTPV